MNWSSREVPQPFHHRNLNEDVPIFLANVPTSENLAFEYCRRMKREWSTVFPGEWPSWKRFASPKHARNIFEMGGSMKSK